MDYLKQNLHNLRAYAKSIGVKTPSIYKKSDLIEKIEEIKNGKTKPHFSAKGRPTSYVLNLKTEKDLVLYTIYRFKDFLNILECEIKNNFE